MNSRNTLMIAVAALILIVGVGVFSAFLLTSSNQKVSDTSNQSKTLISLQSNNAGDSYPATNSEQKAASSGTLEVKTATGSIFVSDFTKGSGVATTSDNFSYVSYPTQTTSTTNDSIQYQIFYFSSDKSLLVSILKEPIGEIRIKATKDLTERLNISHQELCTLVAEVTIPRGVNNLYEGVSLGFPGCPGAIKFSEDINL